MNEHWGWLLTLIAAACGLGLVAVLVAAAGKPFRFTLGFWWVVTWIYCRVWFRCRREGSCTIPDAGPVVLVANHTSPVDPLLLVSGSPRRVPAFLVAREYADLPIGGRFTRMLGCIPVRRDGQDAAASKAALRRLRDGGALGIFLEGRVVPPGQETSPKEGAALLALRTGAVVVPAHIRGTVYDAKVWRSFLRRHRARVRFGAPIDYRDLIQADGKPSRDAVAALAERMMERIRSLGES